MESFITSPQWYNLALTLIHFIWQGGLIALALKLLLMLTPYHKAQLRYTWATLAMLASLVVPIATFIAVYQPNYEPISYFAGDIAAMISTQNLANNDAIAWYQEIFDILPYISLLWLATVSLLASKLFIELHNVTRLPNSASIAPSKELSERFELLANKVGLNKTPRLLISLKTDVPMALGWLKPVILIPASMLSGLTPAQLDMLILHELAHVRRHDYLVNFIQTLVETLLFFHPGVRWISKQMRNEREYCSDDIAVRISGTPVAYAHTLADTAAICRQHRHHAIPTMAMAASGGDLKQRVIRLVDQHHCAAKDDSGKLLATVLIIFSVIAIIVKPYLNANIIDLTSGRISLFQTANEFMQKKPVSAGSLSATSIARLLLQKDKALPQTDNAPFSATENQPAQDEPLVTQNFEAQLTDQQQDSLEVATVVTNSVPEKLAYQVEKKAQPTDVKPQTTKASVTERLLSAEQQPSQSEAAFERTDSSKHSGLRNPYAEQVADLVNEPVHQPTTEPAAQAIKKAATKQRLIKKPLYTISTAKKPEKSVPVMVRKAAKILASPDPRYPSTAKRRGLELDVKINFIIDKQGKVKDIEFEDKHKVSYFRSSIRAAMAKWRFLPAKVNGQPVESKMSKIFSFSLMK